MPRFLQRIIRDGARPVPAAPRVHLPVLELELDARAQPHVALGAHSADVQVPISPVRPASPTLPATVSERPSARRPAEAKPGERSPGRPAPRQDAPPPRAAPLPAPPPAKPKKSAVKSAVQDHGETFVAPRRRVAPPASASAPMQPPQPPPPPVQVLRPMLPSATSSAAESVTVFFRPGPKLAPDTDGPPGHEAAANAPLTTDVERLQSNATSRELRDVIAWIDAETSEATVPETTRVETMRVESHEPTPRRDDSATRSIEQPPMVRDAAVRAPPNQPQPGRPVSSIRSGQAEAAPDIGASVTRGTGDRERIGSPPAARREPLGPRLTVNHLNVQVVNESTPARKEPTRPSVSRSSLPREDWGRFERRHLRVP
jgi:hypothetical protein